MHPRTSHRHHVLSGPCRPQTGCAYAQGQVWLPQRRTEPPSLWRPRAATSGSGDRHRSSDPGWSIASQVFEMHMSYTQWRDCLPAIDNKRDIICWGTLQAMEAARGISSWVLINTHMKGIFQISGFCQNNLKTTLGLATIPKWTLHVYTWWGILANITCYSALYFSK